MAVAGAILKEFPELNDSQRDAISQTDGPLLIIAGPGSGKTLVLVVRALNILIQGLAQPGELLLCTFTEKAAFEMRDRLSLAAKKLGYKGEMSELLIGTIHGICNDFLLRYRHKTPLGNNYQVLDELTQLLFLFDHFEQIFGTAENGGYLTRWTTRWTAIEGARDYFNKITEELVDPDVLVNSPVSFVQAIGNAYRVYKAKLLEKNCIDFAHQQTLFYELLKDPELGSAIAGRVRHVMVDEYQDTNYVQEQLLLRLAEPQKNICVVGDEDQSLYRFRGATVRNILEFPTHFNKCPSVSLSINYRSHADIVNAYDRWMASWNWTNPNGALSFRYNKKIVPDPEGKFPDYPAIFSISGQNPLDEARRFADLVVFLKQHRIIEDESQIALLLHSVQLKHSGHYLRALTDRGIKAFCPRARGYFENEEVQKLKGPGLLILDVPSQHSQPRHLLGQRWKPGTVRQSPRFQRSRR